MTATPPEQPDVDDVLESQDPTVAQLRETYTATAEYDSPRIVETIVESERLEVTTTRPAVAAFEGVDARSLLDPDYDTRVLLPDAPKLADPCFGYVIELDVAQRFLDELEQETVEVVEERIVGAFTPFLSSEPMRMTMAPTPPDQRFGPAVTPATARLERLAEAQAGERLAVRVTRRPLGAQGEHGVGREQPYPIGRVTIAWVST